MLGVIRVDFWGGNTGSLHHDLETLQLVSPTSYTPPGCNSGFLQSLHSTSPLGEQAVCICRCNSRCYEMPRRGVCRDNIIINCLNRYCYYYVLGPRTVWTTQHTRSLTFLIISRLCMFVPASVNVARTSTLRNAIEGTPLFGKSSYPKFLLTSMEVCEALVGRSFSPFSFNIPSHLMCKTTLLSSQFKSLIHSNVLISAPLYKSCLTVAWYFLSFVPLVSANQSEGDNAFRIFGISFIGDTLIAIGLSISLSLQSHTFSQPLGDDSVIPCGGFNGSDTTIYALLASTAEEAKATPFSNCQGFRSIWRYSIAFM